MHARKLGLAAGLLTATLLATACSSDSGSTSSTSNGSSAATSAAGASGSAAASSADSSGAAQSTAGGSSAAGSSGGGATGPVVTIKWWDNQQTESGLSQYQKQAVDTFMASHPNIKVEVETIPYAQYQQKLQLAVQGGTSPDVATVDQIWTAGLAAGGNIVPLDDRLSGSTIKKDAFFTGAWDSAVVDGKLYGIPFNVDVWQFTYYNKTMLSGANIDPKSLTTWDGLEAMGQALTKDGKYGIGLFGAKGESAVVVMDSFIYSNGGQILDDAGKCQLDQPAAVEALEYLKSLEPYAPTGILNNTAEQMRDLFLNGTVATEFWPALEQPALKDQKTIDWGFVAGTAPAGKTPVGTYGGWNLAVFANADDAKRAAAFTFIEYLTSTDVNGKVVDLLPANVAAAEAFAKANRQDPQTILTHLNNAKPRPLSAKYLDVSTIQQDMFQAILNGTPAKDAATQACQKINALQ